MKVTLVISFTAVLSAVVLSCTHFQQEPAETTTQPKVTPPRHTVGTGELCPYSACTVGQVCRRRSLVQTMGPTSLPVDGHCPASSFAAECNGVSGRVCCITMAMTLVDIVDQRCVDAPPNCADCSCMPSDVCGAPDETVQVCAQVQARVVSCGLRTEARSPLPSAR